MTRRAAISTLKPLVLVQIRTFGVALRTEYILSILMNKVASFDHLSLLGVKALLVNAASRCLHFLDSH